MKTPTLVAAFLMAASFTLATQLALWREQSHHARSDSGSVLQILMGDSRRLFANHFVTKADVYLHSGVYPSIFDQARREEESHLTSTVDAHSGAATEAGEIPLSDEHEDEDHDQSIPRFSDRPRDWVEAFGRNFIPTQHVHLESPTEQREMLPWLRLAADLNPNEVEIYPLGAYWLRRMNKVADAERFLREGWRANPDSYQILFELGRLFEENRKDDLRARNLFEAAFRLWERNEPGKEKPDDFGYMQITGHLARLEERDGNFDKSIRYLELLRKVSPNPDSIQHQIDGLKARKPSESKNQG